ncbi:flagellar basal body rod protein FlgB [Candidatus Magnetaquicoccus inordinatus]|uniref:flagellar basal body rod protein FlgB n=1 Tax=Candidatus Magnetaquicoccus inordinatus TaxID=2496818 RepID=UPI00187D0EA3|nr:flagellar basal body rod protein FlgB [Candidatus Magnetaquicoccus inordinatus]
MAEFSLLGAAGEFKANLLDLRQQRQEIITSNVANADTPGYKAKRFEFEDVLKESLPPRDELPMARTTVSHLPKRYEGPVAGRLQDVETPIPKGDGNSVNLEQEMAMQSANQLLYNYAAQSLSSQISTMRMMIDGNTR